MQCSVDGTQPQSGHRRTAKLSECKWTKITEEMENKRKWVWCVDAETVVKRYCRCGAGKSEVKGMSWIQIFSPSSQIELIKKTMRVNLSITNLLCTKLIG